MIFGGQVKLRWMDKWHQRSKRGGNKELGQVTIGGRTGKIKGMNRFGRHTDDIRGEGHMTLGGPTCDIRGD